MKNITPQELKETLKLHQLWLDSGSIEGERVDLSYTNLRYTKLLKGADLRMVGLRGAELYCADLRGANLCHAALSHANLAWANLKNARLDCADLKLANLQGTGILTFNFGQDTAYYHRTNLGVQHEGGLLKIGCEEYSLEYWYNNYVNIGKDHEYTVDEIQLYGDTIESLYHQWRKNNV
jgi:hypothetical protein